MGDATPVIRATKRDVIKSTLEALHGAIPDGAVRRTCMKYLDTLSYCAPEMIDTYWTRVYEFVVTMVPASDEILNIWNTACREYNATVV